MSHIHKFWQFSQICQFFICLLLFSMLSLTTIAAANDDPSPISTDSPMPDLFTGTMKHAIPIKVPAGRNGMTPNISLTYRSSNGNSWLGVGWELEMGSIERSTKKGVTYNTSIYYPKDTFILKGSEGSTELVNIYTNQGATNQYAPKIEQGTFQRIIKNGTYWEVTDKKGTRYIYGQSAETQIYDPKEPSNIFKWCLDQIIDTNGNYITLKYTPKDSTNQIYLSEINYTGNNANPSPATSIKFLLQDRSDAPPLYSSNFAITTAKRLGSIEVWGNGSLVRKYSLAYSASGNAYSPLTQRSMLGSVTEYGSDGTTALPPTRLDYSNGYTVAGGSTSYGFNSYSPNPGWTPGKSPSDNQVSKYCVVGHFGGSSIDVACSTTTNPDGWDIGAVFSHYLILDYLGTLHSTSIIKWPYRPPALSASLSQQCIAGDFKGDGNTGLACNIANSRNWVVAFPDGGESRYQTWPNFYPPPFPMPQIGQCIAGDFNGDGKTDIGLDNYVGRTPDLYMLYSTGSGWSGSAQYGGYTLYSLLTGDFNGDGKTDFAYNLGNSSTWSVSLTGAITGGGSWNSNATIPALSSSTPIGAYCRTGDFNGDGKTDIACFVSGAWQVMLSTGISGWDSTSFLPGGPIVSIPIYEKCITGDFNGDGKTDIACYANGNWQIGFSTGTGWNTQTWAGGPSPTNVAQQCFAADFSGDGKTDILCYTGTSWSEGIANTPQTDLLTHINNGLGGEVSISYVSAYPVLSRLIYPVQIVKGVTVVDGNGNSSTTSYDYSGGYHQLAEKDFRGFNYVKATGPNGPNGEQTITETYFHQGNVTNLSQEDPSVSVGYMKGRPYLTRVSDGQGKVYSETETTYRDLPSPNPNPYYFNPPQTVNTYICDGKATGSGCKSAARITSANYTYDSYGNIIREDRYGDVTNAANPLLNMTTTRSFLPNTTNWIVGLPANESVYQGIGTANSGTNLLVSHTDYYYDDLASGNCNAAPSNNQTPITGNLTRAVKWLNGSSSPEIRMAYDGYGNPVCARDPNGNVSTTVYDPTFQTFPTTNTNAKTQATTSGYYGVGTATDKGSFGQLKSVTDPNNATGSTEYDVIGRITRDIQADGFWTRNTYNSFGTVGSQNIYTDNQFGMWSASYFDGLGRTLKERKSGPDNKVIVTETAYDQRGMVNKVSVPYFEGVEKIPVYQSYTYDPLGRVTKTINPDGKSTLSCFSDLISVTIDENGHRRRETRNPLGRLVTVEEYTGAYTTCDTSQLTPYATTTYTYDVLGNLRFVTDAKGNQTEMRYDTLGRKYYMSDPDMGVWGYGYDANGNLTSQTDANLQTINFAYDELNRLVTKKYGTNTVLTNSYDINYFDTSATNNPKGNLTKMTDASGQAVYKYDSMGRITGSTRTIDSVPYSLGFSYVNGYLGSVTYPDNDSVTYTYNAAGYLQNAGSFANFWGYDALGRPGGVTYGNGAIATYSYDDTTKRLSTLSLTSPQGLLIDNVYFYDNKGNINKIDDKLNKVLPTNLFSETYTPIRAHAVGSTGSGRQFQYDNNGNIKNDGQRSITYNYENMPILVNSVSLVYDGNGTRIKKIAGGVTRTYIDKFYECINGVCGKYIYAGDSRVALKDSNQTRYYHTDHQGSTNIVTNASGAKDEEIAYNPFGGIRQDTSPTGTSVIHKYTGQENDAETGLNNYNARQYDPDLGRFLTPDSIVPDPSNPQSLNRYSYVSNNPINLTDPTGHDYMDFYIGGGGGGGGDPWSNYPSGGCTTCGGPSGTSSGGRGQGSSGGNGTGNSVGYISTTYCPSTTSSVNAWSISSSPGFAKTVDNYLNTALYNFTNNTPGSRINVAMFFAGMVSGPESKVAELSEIVGAAALKKGVAGTNKLLATLKMADHHIFPVQLENYFMSKGLDINKYTVSIPHNFTHLKGIHGRGINNLPGKWNSRWKEFTKDPNVTINDIYQYAGKLMDEYGLSDLSIHPYGK